MRLVELLTMTKHHNINVVNFVGLDNARRSSTTKRKQNTFKALTTVFLIAAFAFILVVSK